MVTWCRFLWRPLVFPAFNEGDTTCARGRWRLTGCDWLRNWLPPLQFKNLLCVTDGRTDTQLDSTRSERSQCKPVPDVTREEVLANAHARYSDMDEDQAEKRGRGRPRKTLESPAKRDSSDEPKAKRGRGRPKGSTKRNKKTVAKSPTSTGKKGRGRPRKNASGDKEADAGSDSSQGGASSASEGKNE